MQRISDIFNKQITDHNNKLVGGIYTAGPITEVM